MCAEAWVVDDPESCRALCREAGNERHVLEVGKDTKISEARYRMITNSKYSAAVLAMNRSAPAFSRGVRACRKQRVSFSGIADQVLLAKGGFLYGSKNGAYSILSWHWVGFFYLFGRASATALTLSPASTRRTAVNFNSVPYSG